MPVGRRPERKLWLRRIGWLALIWATSVISLGIVAALMRVLMELAGLTNPRIVSISATGAFTTIWAAVTLAKGSKCSSAESEPRA
jgi:hypothetical protein